MSRKPVIAANWKMFKTRPEARRTCAQLCRLVGDYNKVEIVVCPPFTALETAREVLQGSVIGLGAQNVHWEPEGAFTGEISAEMLVDAGCRYVILGHSERRQLARETNREIQHKLQRVLSSELTPILCVGETLKERDAGAAREVILAQLERALAGLTAPQVSHIILAYEPVWAIGTGRTATPEIAQDVHYLVRAWLGERFSREVPGRVRILYGGSVKPDNVVELMKQDDIDGALVGGASLEAASFAKLAKFAELE